MPPSIASLEFSNYFGGASVGVMIAGCLIAAFVILAVVVSFVCIRSMRKQLNLLNEDIRAGQATEEELCGIGARSTESKQRRDPWQN